MFLLILNDCSQHLNMSDSEEEFFLATQMPQSGNSRPDGAKVKEKVVSDGSLSVVDYFFLVTFNWDLMVGDPFKMTVLEVIKDFPEDWITGPLNESSRKMKFPVKAFDGGEFSLFCKVQKGRPFFIKSRSKKESN